MQQYLFEPEGGAAHRESVHRRGSFSSTAAQHPGVLRASSASCCSSTPPTAEYARQAAPPCRPAAIAGRRKLARQAQEHDRERETRHYSGPKYIDYCAPELSQVTRDAARIKPSRTNMEER